MSVSLFARLHHRFGPHVDREARRRFLKVSAGVTGAALLSGCRVATTPQVGRGKRVVVVGAGFAGLSAAYELRSVGYDVQVVEARDRISGRVLSFNDRLTKAFVPGRNVEGGGELIGSNHPCWVHYADRFKLRFLDVTISELEAPIVIDGRRLSESESNRVWEEMGSTFSRMNDDARHVNVAQPWRTRNADALDRLSVGEWLKRQADLDPLTRRGCDVQLASDNGQAIDRQSYLGMLASVAGGGVERYWTETEVYRCDGGNMQLAHKLADGISRDRITLGMPVVSIDTSGSTVRVTRADGQVVECDDVIVAVPPSVWPKIAFTPALPPELSPQMGTNVKWLANVNDRFWKGLNVAPDSLGDDFCSQTWEGTDAQDGGGPAELTAFSGGDAAVQSLAIAENDRDAAYVRSIEKRYPGLHDYLADTRYMAWPRDPWTMAGYSFPAPGQVTTVGPRLYDGIGRLHFAGEHCCYAFVGYMEGGLTSGTSLARRLAARDGRIVPPIPMPPTPASKPAEPATTEPANGPLKTPATTQAG